MKLLILIFIININLLISKNIYTKNNNTYIFIDTIKKKIKNISLTPLKSKIPFNNIYSCEINNNKIYCIKNYMKSIYPIIFFELPG
jgi:hypothetical protein